MPKSLPMLDPNVAPAPGDMLYTLKDTGLPDRDQRSTLMEVLQAYLSGAFEDLGTLAWDKGQPITNVPAWRPQYPSGDLEQGWLNLRDVLDPVSNVDLSWNITSESPVVALESYTQSIRVAVSGNSDSARTFTLTGTPRAGQEIWFFVGTANLTTPALIKHGTDTLATVRGGELVRVYTLGTTLVAQVVADVQHLRDAIAAETLRATTAEGVLTTAVSAETSRATAAEGVLTSALNAQREFRGTLPRTGDEAFVATDGFTTKPTTDSLINGTPASFLEIALAPGNECSRVSLSLQFGLDVPFSASDRFVEFGAVVETVGSNLMLLAQALAQSNGSGLNYHEHFCTVSVRKSDGSVWQLPAKVLGLPGGVVIRPHLVAGTRDRLLWSEYTANFGNNTVVSIDFSTLVPAPTP